MAVARETRRFLTDGAWAHQDAPPAEVLAAEINSDDDALENVMRLLLRAKPAGDLDMHDTLRGLREACVARLAAAQRKIPVRAPRVTGLRARLLPACSSCCVAPCSGCSSSSSSSWAR